MRVLLVALSLVLATVLFAPGATAAGDCVGKPGQVQVCQNLFDPAFNNCVSASVGLQGASVCSGVNGLAICTSINGGTCLPIN